jgi:hypothetical protein
MKPIDVVKQFYDKVEDYYSFDIYYKKDGLEIEGHRLKPYIAISQQSKKIEITGNTLGEVHKTINSWW